ncbi:uncharacterized protein LOC106881258 [Octopus bimaculoides]|uniref:Fibronectin type-III domain-containing protein n=1 Tax=Octopus bimaculoides TaxID=37653 RepID=A0A0L8FTH3_OCTBM|nr:uncharacterized protein LOC106881258 [Octopus bimaculoides]|eukprot:XP_014787065.1 PREDICTED: uncharacterized protein LOC106881258 [Octopus bimaculoides]
MANNVPIYLNELNEDASLIKPVIFYTPLFSPITTENPNNSVSNDDGKITSCSKLYSSVIQRPMTESKYEAYDNRPIRSLGKNFYKTFADPSFSCSPPPLSRSEPTVYKKKKVNQQLMNQALNYDEGCHEKVLPLLHEKVKSNRLGIERNSDIFRITPGKFTIVSAESNLYLASLHCAATCIQAAWRGYYCRNFVCHVKNIQLELRNQRAEKHINKLSSDLQRQQMQCDKKSNLLRQLMEIVQVLCNKFHLKQTHLSADEQPATKKFLSEIDILKESYNSLQIQVKHLHETLHTFMMGSFKYFEAKNKDSPKMFLENNAALCSGKEINDGVWDSKSIECKINERNDLVNPVSQETVHETFPPADFTLVSTSKKTVVLSWNLVNDMENLRADKLLGFKIYINGQPKALVPKSQTRIIISDLIPSLTYKFNVTTVSAFQESKMSPTIIAVYHCPLEPLDDMDENIVKRSFTDLEGSYISKQHFYEKPDNLEKIIETSNSTHLPDEFMTTNSNPTSILFPFSSPNQKDICKQSQTTNDRTSPETSHSSTNKTDVKHDQFFIETLNSITNSCFSILSVTDGHQTLDNWPSISVATAETSGSDQKKMTVAETVEQHFLQCKKNTLTLDSNEGRVILQANQRKSLSLSDVASNPTSEAHGSLPNQESALSLSLG